MLIQDRTFLLSLFKFDNKLSENSKIKKIYSITNSPEKYYRKFKIKKSSGKLRTIYSPNYYLKMLQKYILTEILEIQECSKYAKAYLKGVSIYDNVKPHQNKKIIVKLDILNFFDNISFYDVYHIFISIGFKKNLAGVLAKLCTYDDILPQGAVSSAYLSNLVMKKFDEELGNWCDANNINYTRYSDDMTFSMDEFNNELLKKVRRMLYSIGFELNERKIKVIYSSQKQIVTGIVLNEKIQCDINFRKKIRQEMYYINKYGIESFLTYLKINIRKDKYLMSLKGKINYALQFDKNNQEFQKYLKEVNFLLKK